MFSIGMATMIIGVCTKTLRRWEKRNQLLQSALWEDIGDIRWGI